MTDICHITSFESRHDKTNKVTQSFRCPHEKSLGPQLPIERTAKTDQTGQMPRLI